MPLSGEEGEAALGCGAEKEAVRSLNLPVPVSGSRHIPVRAQAIDAVSSLSSATSSSTDEEMDSQLSLQAKVIALGRARRALAGEGRLPSRLHSHCELQLQWFFSRLTSHCM